MGCLSTLVFEIFHNHVDSIFRGEGAFHETLLNFGLS